MGKELSGLDTLFGEKEADKKKSKDQPKADRKVGATKANDATKEGEVRATFIVKESKLEKLKAIAYWERAKIKDIHDAALEMYLNSRTDIPKILSNRKEKSR